MSNEYIIRPVGKDNHILVHLDKLDEKPIMSTLPRHHPEWHQRLRLTDEDVKGLVWVPLVHFVDWDRVNKCAWKKSKEIN